MIELLRSIPGPRFLLYYPLLVTATVLIARLLLHDRSPGFVAPPDPSRFSPAALAAWQGGWRQMLKTALFSLWQRGFFELVPEEENGTGKDQRFRRNAQGTPPADRLERALWSFAKSEKRPGDFLADAQLRAFAETHCRKLEELFEKEQLLRSAPARRQRWLTTLAVLGTVYAVGGGKCLLGLLNHKPTGFLIVMLILTLPLVLLALKPWQRLTAQGETYRIRLAEHFAWMKQELAGEEAPQFDPAYAVAVFGTAVVAGTLLYATFDLAFPTPVRGDWSSDSGSSGCGGSSCGGGGCGGGCGGCGGD